MSEPRMVSGTPMLLDPSENLREQTEVARQIQKVSDPDAVRDAVLDSPHRYDQYLRRTAETVSDYGIRLAELVLALDQHLAAGGLPPARWTGPATETRGAAMQAEIDRLVDRLREVKASWASASAEIDRLRDHLHGCREEREAAEALRAKAERTLQTVREYVVEALEPDEDDTVTIIRRGRGHTEEEDWRDALTQIRNMIDNATPAIESAETRLRSAIEKVLPALAKEFQYLAVERNFDGTPSCVAQAPQEESWIVKTLREALR